MARSFFINDYYDDLVGCYFPDSFGAACNVTSDCGSDEGGILQCCSYARSPALGLGGGWVWFACPVIHRLPLPVADRHSF